MSISVLRITMILSGIVASCAVQVRNYDCNNSVFKKKKKCFKLHMIKEDRWPTMYLMLKAD